jgi:hypothetical protein
MVMGLMHLAKGDVTEARPFLFSEMEFVEDAVRTGSCFGTFFNRFFLSHESIIHFQCASNQSLLFTNFVADPVLPFADTPGFILFPKLNFSFKKLFKNTNQSQQTRQWA